MNDLDALKARIPEILAIGLGFRFWLDLALLPVETAQLLTGLWGLVFAALGATALRGHPLRWPLVAFVAWSALRLDGTTEGLRYGLHLWIPLAWLLASEKADRDWPRWILLASILPIGWSLMALGMGQPAEHVLHDVPRLHGGYRNLHGHAVAMATLASVGTWIALEDRDRLWRGLGVGMAALAGVALLFTWVRTLWIFLAIVVVVLLLLGRWYRSLGATGIAAIGAVIAVPPVRHRLADLGSVLTWTPPEQGWGAIGSWRVRIWIESIAGFNEGPWWTWVVGRGLGAHIGLHKNLDPHNEYLALIFQLGAVGFLLWLWLMGAALLVCWKAGSAGRLGVALIVAVLLTNGISNEWLTRATLQWVTFASIGMAVQARRSTMVHGG